MKTTAVAIIVSLLSIVSFAGWQIGSFNLKKGNTTVTEGYTAVSVEAISDTLTGSVNIYYITHVPVTNTFATLSLSNGHAVSDAIQVTFKDGDILYTTGTPLTNGSARVSVRK